MGGDHFWKSICFAMHQINASPKEHDDVHHQHQLALRSLESELGLLSKICSISIAHKGTRIASFRRSLFLAMIAIGNGLAFYVAAGLSSRYFAGHQVVLVRTQNCGAMNEPDLSRLTDDVSFEAADAMIVNSRNGYRKSAAYAKTCYAQTGNSTAACSTYVKPRLSYNVTRNAQCPFDERICNGTGITLDSGFIRSDADMGINTHPRDAISVRKSLRCVPLAGEKYTDGWHPIADEVAMNIGIPLNGSLKAYKLNDETADLPPMNYYFWVTDFHFQIAQRPYILMYVFTFCFSTAHSVWGLMREFWITYNSSCSINLTQS